MHAYPVRRLAKAALLGFVASAAAITLALGTATTAWAAPGGTVTNLATLKTAFGLSAADGDANLTSGSITLSGETTVTTPLKIQAGSYTVDLDGHKLTIDGGSSLTVDAAASLTIQSSKMAVATEGLEAAAMAKDEPVEIAYSATSAISLGAGTAELKGGVLTFGTNTTLNYNGGTPITVAGSAATTAGASLTIQNAELNGKAITVSAGTADKANGGTLTIAGKVTGAGTITASNGSVKGALGGSIVVNGSLATSGIATGAASVEGTLPGTLLVNANGEVKGPITNGGEATINGSVEGTVSTSGALTVAGPIKGNVTASGGSVNVNTGGSVTASSGDAISASGKAEITVAGGEVKATGDEGIGIKLDGTSTLTVFSGNVTGKKTAINIAAAGAGAIINGGTITGPVERTTGSKYVINAGSFTVQPTTADNFDNYVVQVDRLYVLGNLATVQSALNGAKSSASVLQLKRGVSDWALVAPGGVKLSRGQHVLRSTAHLITLDGNGGTWGGAKTLMMIVGSGVKGLPDFNDPGNAGHALIGWYTQGSNDTWVAQNPDVFTTTDDAKLYAQWASIAVSLTPAESSVTSGSTVILHVATQVKPVTEGIAVPSNLSLGNPDVTATGANVNATYSNGVVNFRAPDDSATISVAISFMGGAATSESGYASAKVYVVPTSGVSVAVNPQGSGVVSGPVLNANGTYTLTATPNPGYVFESWSFSDKLPSGVNVLDNPIEVPGDVIGTWTANFVVSQETVQVHRLWNPYTGAHLLSSDSNEVLVLTSQHGWRDEGVKLVQYRHATEGRVGIVRLYNPYNGDHLYTTSEAEAADLWRAGWRNEGVKFAGPASGGAPVYRLWNSLQKANGGLGSHLWTADGNEYTTLPTLTPVGAWKQEGIVWQAVRAYL